MRIVHTSDWHMGRRWKGIRRFDEMEAIIDNLADFIERESIDLVLHSGDVFDGHNPTAKAERMVYEFFLRVGRAGAQMVVIAGNHDDARHFDALGLLTRFTHVHLVGRPRPANQGGTAAFQTRNGEVAMVAALPFASPGLFVSALELAKSETAARSKYAQMFQLAVQSLASVFRQDTVNLVVAHTQLHGAVFGASERRVHLGDDWAATSQSLPTTASYIALGHIHKPQKVEGLLPAYYGGSPLQLDFGEVGDEKTFNVVEAQAGRPARVQKLPYQGGQPLVEVRGTLAEIEASVETHRSAGWLRVTVQLPGPDPDINRKIRDWLPNALVVRVELPEADRVKAERPNVSAPPVEHYRAFHRQHYEEEPDQLASMTFEQLYETISTRAGG